MNEVYAHLCPEWILQEALKEWCNDKARFWNEPIFAILKGGSWSDQISLASQFQSPDEYPQLLSEDPLPEHGFDRYGIPEDKYRKYYWSLRPDFSVGLKNNAFDSLVFLEAKGKSLTWKRREAEYFSFLEAANVSKGGFFYIVPRQCIEDCQRQIQKFCWTNDKVTIGYTNWEQFGRDFAKQLLNKLIDWRKREMDESIVILKRFCESESSEN
ncbi:hypothetical protein HY256_02785 [Candidatus Sumerlaeota bacterium]|nr:hypothetical protein [Candidatus Sumerlaeota bacterium]